MPLVPVITAFDEGDGVLRGGQLIRAFQYIILMP